MIRSAAQGAPARDRPVTQAAVFLGFFVLVTLLKLPTLEQPPVWDGSFSVFPAAATLAENGFDYADLLDRPGYRDAGPNVHSLSAVTLMTAVALRLFDEGAVPALHLLNYAIAAAAGLGLYLLARRTSPPRLAIAIAAAGLLAPVVLTQAGSIYLELPVLAVTVWASVAFLNDRRGIAAVFAVAAVLVKQSGVIVGVALALATLVDPRKERRSATAALTLIVPPVLVALTLVALGPSTAVDLPFLDVLITAFANSARFLLRIPDVAALLLVFLALRPAVASRPPLEGGDRLETLRTESLVRSLLVGFGTFYVIAGGLGFAALPRYWSHVVPFVVLGTTLVARRIAAERAVSAAVAVVGFLFLLNLNGLLYPPVGQNNFPVAERSGEYRQLLDVQLEVAAAIEALPDDVPVFYTQAHHYWVRYPASGYVSAPVTNGINMAVDPRREDPLLGDFPDDFFVAFESAALGGRALSEIYEQARNDPRYVTDVTEFRSGEFWSRLVRITLAG